MYGVRAAVAPDVEVPAVGGRDDADVLASGLGALTGAARDAHFQLVRGPQAAVAQLELDGHGHRVLHAETAPGGTYTGLHVAQGFAVGVAGLEACLYELLPNVRQLLEAGAEHVDA